MFKRFFLLTAVAALVLLTACSLADSGQRGSDAAAAQSFIPESRDTGFTDYDVRSVDYVQDAIATVLQGAGALSGNLVGAAMVNRFNTLVNCYQERGALDARAYTQKLSVVLQGQVPAAGFLIVINQDRVADNFLSCLTQNPVGDVFGAQAAQPEPCVGSGSFVFEGDTISFAFAATDMPLCNAFANYYNRFGAQTSVSPVVLPGN